MFVYAVSYDLRKPGQNYIGLIDTLKASPNWWHFLESTWLVKTHETPAQLWSRLSSQVDRNDSVLIIDVGNNYTGWLPEKAWEWIRNNVSRN